MNLTYALREYLTPGGAYYSPENYHPWAPTQGYSYSNVAIALLGLVVQTVSGEDFYEYPSPILLLTLSHFPTDGPCLLEQVLLRARAAAARDGGFVLAAGRHAGCGVSCSPSPS